MRKRFMQQVQAQIQTQLWLSLSQPMRSSSPHGVIGVLGTGLMLTGATIALSGSIAQASSLQWQYDPESAALSVSLPPGTTPRYFLAAQPARIVVDLPNTDIGTVQTEKQFPGAVQQIRVAQFQPGVARIVMQLAPGTVLAPQQIDLQQAGGDRWVLRPVLADANPASASAAPVSPAPAVSPAANAVIPAPADAASESSASESSASESAIAANQPTANLPPLEPGATEIPVELPPAEAAAAPPPTVSVPSLSAANPTVANPTAANPTAPIAAPSAAPIQSNAPAEAEPTAGVAETAAVPENPTAETPAPAIQPPETSALTAQAPASSAPEAQANSQPAGTAENPAEATTAALPQELPPAEPESLPTELPPATFTPSAESTVNVPALNAPSSPNSPSSSPARNRDIAAIEFGQPLPGTESTTEPAREPARQPSPEPSRETSREPSDETTVAVNSAPGVLLPAGTVLNLRYQGEATLNLANDYPLQEVLVVDREIRDQSGQIVVPAGSQVIGRFETGSSGSEFIAQGISIDGQNFLLNGRSDKLSGGRQVSGNRMAMNSAIGAVAGTLLGAVTGVGLIAGIAAGAATSAATTYLTAPQPAVIEPDRVVEVRLLEDLRQPGYGIGG